MSRVISRVCYDLMRCKDTKEHSTALYSFSDVLLFYYSLGGREKDGNVGNRNGSGEIF